MVFNYIIIHVHYWSDRYVVSSCERSSLTMTSPHASSFICLPYSSNPEVALAHGIYFATCLGSALIGVVGASLFLFQVVRNHHEKHPGSSRSQMWILIMLSCSDLLADIGESGNGGDSEGGDGNCVRVSLVVVVIVSVMVAIV